jgi:hypothetical protein
MRNMRAAILAICLITLGSVAALAGINNTATGSNALANDTTGDNNTADGFVALVDNTTGSYNTAVGTSAMQSNTTGNFNTAVGEAALPFNTSGNENTAVGYSALYSNTTASWNTATGFEALVSNTTGSFNTAVGFEALYYSTTGGNNTAVGYYAGRNNPNGASNNIDIGNQGSSSDNSTIRIGTLGTQTSFYAAGIDGVTVSGGVEVFINSSGQLGTVNSSLRFKEDVHDMGDASSAILQLRPVTYRYKQPYADGSKPTDYGLIAEEVAKVYPDLVVKGADGQIQTVQYQKLTPMLLNELQKQHQLLEQMGRAMAQQQATIRLLKTQQTQTVQLLEKRLAALEAEKSPARLEARVATR